MSVSDGECDDELLQQQEAIWRQIQMDNNRKQQQQQQQRMMDPLPSTTRHHGKPDLVATGWVPTSSGAATSMSLHPPWSVHPLPAAAIHAVHHQRDDEDLRGGGDAMDEYFQDEAMIQEQFKILEQIEHGKKPRKSAPLQQQVAAMNHKNDFPQTTVRPTQSDGTVRCSLRSRQDHHLSDRERLEEQSNITNIKGSTPRNSYVKDSLSKIGSQSLRIKGTQHAYQSIANGTATIVQCMGCRAVLQVPASSKLLYCTVCNQVTPIQQQQQPSAGGGTGTLFTPAIDQQIARTVQQQELDVAYSRKQSKLKGISTRS